MSLTSSHRVPNPPYDDDEFRRSAASERLAAVGTLLFGPRFHAALANEMKVSRPLICAMVNGQRRVTPDMERRLASTIRSRIVPELESKIETLASLAQAIDGKLSAYPAGRFDVNVDALSLERTS